ncbi:MAG TPA: xanthine dehydrogenase family protein molybdopterin-binding subunit [Acidimicrobiales bacterium]|nr:xanthine dehydrogenase family protein molybdopterin-binding subunit [Acidimicrobiales bacterium]
MSILGNRVPRIEDPRFLTGQATFVDNLRLPGAAHVTYVTSTIASARITGIEVAEARESPGVIDVVTAADLDLEPYPVDMAIFNEDMVRPWLATDVVRFVGEPVVAIVAETAAQGEDAADLVWVDYDPLPAVVDPEEARLDELLLHAGAGTNVAFRLPAGKHTVSFDDCEVVVTQRIVNQRVAPCPLEVRAAAAEWGDDGRLTLWLSTQGSHPAREKAAEGLGLELSDVRVIVPDVGGGFGAKGASYPEELLLGWLARRVGRPLRWTEARSASMNGLGHGRGQIQQVTMGGTREGTVEAIRLEVLQDAGAYPRMGAVLPYMTRTMATGVYTVGRVEFSSTSVVTNTTPTVAYRGAGRPEAAAALERTMDIFATELGMDPAEVRRRNLVPADAFPYTTAVGTLYDCGEYEQALDLVLSSVGYDDLRAEQRRRREAGERRQLGIGLSVYVEITGSAGDEHGSVEVLPDGRVIARTGTTPYGQGHATTWAMLVAERLGVPISDVEVISGDTDLFPTGTTTGGSRSVQLGGTAMAQASDVVVERARHLAADLLEANPDDVVLDLAEGRFHVTGTPAVARSWGEVAGSAGDDGLRGEALFESQGATFPFGAHVAVVEVDIETGQVQLVRMVAVDDAGRIVNPLIAEGQIHGGLAQGVAQALMEEVRYDEDGNPLTANLADYGFPSAADLPSFESIRMETPTPNNPLGAKGIGESGTIGSTPAMQNAVVDAVSHLGVRHIDMPTTPEKVWRAIQAAGGRVRAR